MGTIPRAGNTSTRRVKHNCNVMETARDPNGWLQLTDAEEEGGNNIWKGKRKEKTNFLPSPSGKSIKEKKNCSKSLLVNKQKVSGTGTSGNEGNKCYSGKIKIGDAKGR